MTTYAAFISYRHGGADARWARWLHRALESYRPPAPYTAAWRANRFFRDEEELAASADLSDTLRAALDASDALVVVCSPRTPESRWVAEEVNQFRAMGRGDRVFVLLTAGEPADSFPLPLRGPGVAEPLAADVRDGRRMDALLRIVAALLKVPFDDLKRRDDERRRRRRAAVTAGVAALAVVFLGLAVYAFGQADLAETRRVAAVQAEGREREQRIAADTARQGEQEQKELAEERFARGELDRGLEDATGGRVPVGLHRMAQAAALAKPASPLAIEAERLLAEWGVGLGYPLATGETTVTSAAISADGSLAAVGDEQGRVTLWRTGEPLALVRSLAHDPYRIVSLTFSPDGRWLAAAEFYSHVSVWDVATRKRVARLCHIEDGQPGPYSNTAYPADVSFSPDGSQIALSWQPPVNVLQLFRLPAGEPVADSATYNHGVADHRFTLNGERVIVIDYGGFRHLVRTDTGEIAERPKLADGTPSGSGTTLGPGSVKQTRYLRRLEDAGTELREFQSGGLVGERWTQLDTAQAAFSPDGRRLATSHGTVVRLWDAATGTPLRPDVAADARVTALAWSADGTRVAVGDDGGTATVWEIVEPKKDAGLPDHRRLGVPLRLAGSVVGLYVHPTKPWLLAAAGGEVRWWSWADREPTPVPPVVAEVVARSPDGAWVVEKSGRGFEVVRPASGDRRRLAAVDAKQLVTVETVAVAGPDRIVGVSSAGWVMAWNAADGVLVAKMQTKPLAYNVLAIRPAGPDLFVAGSKDTVYRFTLTADRFTAAGEFADLDRGSVRAVHLADTGGRLAILGNHGVEMIDPADGRRVASVPIRDYPSASALHPAGRLLAVAGDHAAVVLIDVRDGRVVREFGGGVEARSLAFSPDGTVLAAGWYAGFRDKPAVVARWWTATGSALPALPGGQGDVAFDAAGRLIVGTSGSLSRWERATDAPTIDRPAWLTARTGLTETADRPRRADPPALVVGSRRP